MTAFIANSNILELTGLQAHVDDTYINDAAVEVTVKDAEGVNVPGVTWPVTMSYVAASNGIYRATLSEDLAFVHKQWHIAYIDADAGAGRVGHWEFWFKPLTRKVTEEV